MLKLDLISKAFGGKEILRNISIVAQKGERIAIFGPSGIGKSTILRIIAGLDQNFEGSLEAPQNIGLMFQSPNLLMWRSARANLAIFHPKAGAKKIDDALKEVGLSEKSEHFPNQLSLGQQRRLALARTFLGMHDLILLDEPFSSLDEALRGEMITLTNRLINDATLILVTHCEMEAKDLGCKVIKLAH